MKQTRFYALLLSLALCLSLLSCGGGEKYQDGTLAGTTLSGEGGGRVFTAEPLQLPRGGRLETVARAADCAYFTVQDEEGRRSVYRYETASGTVSAIEGLQPESLVGLNGYSRGIAHIQSLTTGGLCSYSIANPGVGNMEQSYTTQPLALPPKLSGRSITQVVSCPDGTLVLAEGLVYGCVSEAFRDPKLNTFGPYGGNVQLLCNSDDSLYIVSDEGENTRVQRIEETFVDDVMQFVEAESWTLEGHYLYFYPGEKAGQLFAWRDDIVYDIDCKSGSALGYANTYASAASAQVLQPLSNTAFLGAVQDGSPAIFRLEQSTEIKVLTLATCSGIDADSDYVLRNAVADFNAYSQNYRIDLQDYGSVNGGGDVREGVKRLHAEIMAGNTPDIFDLWTLNSADYAAKGFLEDLKPWFECDGEIAYEDMLPSVTAALEQNGALYELVPSFSVSTVFAADSRMGAARHLNVDALLQLGQTVAPAKIFGTNMTRQKFLSGVVAYTGAEFIDRANKSCHFDTPQFAGLLRFAAGLPETPDENSGDMERIYNGEQLLYSVGRQNIVEWITYADTVFAEQAKSIGFPCDGGSGVACTPVLRLGMSVNSQSKDGVWAFFRYLLSERYQENTEAMPIMRVALNAAFDRCEKSFDGIRAVGLAWMEGERVVTAELPVRKPDSATRERAMEILESIDCVNELDGEVQNMIEQEAAAFFAGQETAEEAAQNIQRRAELYLAEQYG